MRDLLKSGVLKDKPLWYDVVATFTPVHVVEADFDRQPERGNVKRIVYPEDSIRRLAIMIHSTMHLIGLISLAVLSYDRHERITKNGKFLAKRGGLKFCNDPRVWIESFAKQKYSF